MSPDGIDLRFSLAGEVFERLRATIRPAIRPTGRFTLRHLAPSPCQIPLWQAGLVTCPRAVVSGRGMAMNIRSSRIQRCEPCPFRIAQTESWQIRAPSLSQGGYGPQPVSRWLKDRSAFPPIPWRMKASKLARSIKVRPRLAPGLVT